MEKIEYITMRLKGNEKNIVKQVASASGYGVCISQYIKNLIIQDIRNSNSEIDISELFIDERKTRWMD